jgi:hypothetical protein
MEGWARCGQVSRGQDRQVKPTGLASERLPDAKLSKYTSRSP